MECQRTLEDYLNLYDEYLDGREDVINNIDKCLCESQLVVRKRVRKKYVNCIQTGFSSNVSLHLEEIISESHRTSKGRKTHSKKGKEKYISGIKRNEPQDFSFIEGTSPKCPTGIQSRSNTLNVIVRCPGRQTLCLALTTENTISDVKLQVKSKLGLPFHIQKLRYQGKPVKNKQLLNHLKGNGDLHLSLMDGCLLGGMWPEKNDESELAKKIMDGLKKNRVIFLRNSSANDTFFDYIIQYDVTQDSKHEEIMDTPLNHRMRVLVDYLRKRSVKDQLWFARALCDDGQEFILEEELLLTEAEIAYIKSMRDPTERFDTGEGVKENPPRQSRTSRTTYSHQDHFTTFYPSHQQSSSQHQSGPLYSPRADDFHYHQYPSQPPNYAHYHNPPYIPNPQYHSEPTHLGGYLPAAYFTEEDMQPQLALPMYGQGTSIPKAITEAPQVCYDSKFKYPQIVVLGETFMIYVDIYGLPIPDITWFHNNEVVTNGDGVNVKTTKNYSMVEITKCKIDDMGKYVVQAKNSSGCYTATYEVKQSSGQASQDSVDPVKDLKPPDTFEVHVTTDKTVFHHRPSHIIVTVPEGTVREGETCTITCKVLTDFHHYKHILDPAHDLVTRVVECEACYDILKPVQIRIPLFSHKYHLHEENIRVFFTHQDRKKEISKGATENYSFKVDGNVIVIQTMKFGRFHCECSNIQRVYPVPLDPRMTPNLYNTKKDAMFQSFIHLGLAMLDVMKTHEQQPVNFHSPQLPIGPSNQIQGYTQHQHAAQHQGGPAYAHQYQQYHCGHFHQYRPPYSRGSVHNDPYIASQARAHYQSGPSFPGFNNHAPQVQLRPSYPGLLDSAYDPGQQEQEQSQLALPFYEQDPSESTNLRYRYQGQDHRPRDYDTNSSGSRKKDRAILKRNQEDEINKKALIKVTPELLEKMNIDSKFLAILVAENVITFSQKLVLKEKTKMDQISDVIDYTIQDIRGRYNGFTEALQDTGHEHILALLREEISNLRATQTCESEDEPTVSHHGE